jgi:hypothetical protein
MAGGFENTPGLLLSNAAFVRRKGQRRERCPLMRAVAERLFFRFAVATPIVGFARLYSVSGLIAITRSIRVHSPRGLSPFVRGGLRLLPQSMRIRIKPSIQS